MAKEQKQEPVPVPAPDVSEEQGPPKSYRMQITLGFVSLILFEVLVLWLSLPPRQIVQKNIGLGPVDNVQSIDDVGFVPRSIGSKEDVVTQPLRDGAFKITKMENEDNVKFSLVLHVAIREKDKKNFTKRYGICKEQVIARITTILKGTTFQEREEPAYTVIRQKIKKEINDILGTPWVLDVLVSDPVHEVG